MKYSVKARQAAIAAVKALVSSGEGWTPASMADAVLCAYSDALEPPTADEDSARVDAKLLDMAKAAGEVGIPCGALVVVVAAVTGLHESDVAPRLRSLLDRGELKLGTHLRVAMPEGEG